MKVAVTLPVVIRLPSLYAMTLRCLELLRVSEGWRKRTGADFCVTLVCNRLGFLPEDVERDVRQRCGLRPSRVVIVNEGDLGVAGGWNRGVREGMAWGADRFVILANDIEAEADAVEALVDYGDRRDRNRVAVWSGVATNDGAERDRRADAEGCDFSFFGLRRSTIERHGWFDEMFRPAYFEDNDYAARVVLAGEHHRYFYGARFYHHVSQTLKQDDEMAHHIRHWFAKNRERFARKWGRHPVGDEMTILNTYNRSPFNSGQPLSWWGPE